ncbi:hypothetical protein [Erythrobacter sp. YT30]|uniref:hypothetical protein n=1 Tax=Erythrobacter sp. YT30 TaxID=1735012 RepID=UPI00076CA656|nr:hypothetical protein [Erythrobacter sp. YT30]KWV91236.1 hypothetical protein AUC45_08025 [Erythrobacter sp. YT30]
MTAPGDQDASEFNHGNDWKSKFIRNLVETSSVTKSAALLKVSLQEVVDARRNDTEFEREWEYALDEGYAELEWEILRRLKEGDFATATEAKYDFTNAIRFLISRREFSAKHQSERRIVSAAEVRAAIDTKIEDLRLRVARENAKVGPVEE